MNFNTRQMNSADAQAIAKWLPGIALFQRYGLTEERAAQLLSDAIEAGDILIVHDASKEERARGFAWCIKEGTFCKAPYLRLLAVHPEHSSCGIGTNLLITVEKNIRPVSSRLTLLVSDFNIDAQRFYRRNGFEKVGVLEDFALEGVSEFIFSKRLDR